MYCADLQGEVSDGEAGSCEVKDDNDEGDQQP